MKKRSAFVVTASHGPFGRKTEPVPRRGAPSHPRSLSRQGAAPVFTWPQPISMSLSARDPCNRRLHDRIRAGVRPVHRHDLN